MFVWCFVCVSVTMTHLSLIFNAEGHVIIIQCTYSMTETAQLRAAIKEYEDLMRDYKEQVGQIER